MKKIYGVSSKLNFGQWYHKVVVFNNNEDAEKWLNTEEFDFAEREICNKTKAIQLAGAKAVKNPLQYEIIDGVGQYIGYAEA